MEQKFKSTKQALVEFDLRFAETVKLYKATSENWKTTFCKKENLNAWSKAKDFKVFYTCFKDYYKWNSFSYTPDLKLHYDTILNKDLYYKWNVPIQEIEKCIQAINAGGILYIPKNIAIVLSILTLEAHINLYISLKLAHLIISLPQFKKEPHTDEIKKRVDVLKEFENYQRRKEYNKEAQKSNLDQMLDDLTGYLLSRQTDGVKIAAEEETKAIYSKLKRGKPEQLLLKMLFNACLPSPHLKEYEKYVAFFPLLRLLLKDKVGGRFTLYTEAYFEENVSKYDGDYKKYQKSRVERILGL